MNHGFCIVGYGTLYLATADGYYFQAMTLLGSTGGADMQYDVILLDATVVIVVI